MPSTRGAYDDPVGFPVSVMTAATPISLLVTPGAFTGLFTLRLAGSMLDVAVPPPCGIVDFVSFEEPEFPHAAATSKSATDTTANFARMLPPGRSAECWRVTLTSYSLSDKAAARGTDARDVSRPSRRRGD